MRPVLFLISIILLSTLFNEAQCRHLRRQNFSTGNNKPNMLQENGNLRSKGSNGDNIIDVCKDEHCSSPAGTMKRRLSRSTKVSHHWFPSIHEDYYGPRGHKPKHH